MNKGIWKEKSQKLCDKRNVKKAGKKRPLNDQRNDP